MLIDRAPDELPSGGEASRARSRSAWGQSAAAGATLLGIALCVYPPWERTLFPVRDDPFLLVVLRQHADAPSRFVALMRWLLEDHGRFYPISSIMYVVNWTLFDGDAVAWQVWRFALMLGLSIAAYAVLRRIGARPTAALAGAMLFVCGGGAVRNWSQHNLAEPIGVAFLLGAAWLAVGFQWTARPRRVAAAVALLVTATVMIKETFISCVPFLLLLALCRDRNGTFRLPCWSRRDRLLVATLGSTAALLAVLLLVLVRAGAERGVSHASNYSLANLTVAHFLSVVRLMVVPITRTPQFPANVLAAGIVGAGLMLMARRTSRGNALLLATTALSLPLAGVLIYLPWSFTLGYYAYPYVLGIAMLFALSLEELARYGRVIRLASWVAAAGVALQGALLARNQSAEFRAVAYVDGGVAKLVGSAAAGGVRAVVAVPAGMPAGLGVDLRNLAIAYGARDLRAIGDVSCEEAAAMLRDRVRSATVVVFSRECPHFERAGVSPNSAVTAGYVVRDWKTLRARRELAEGRIWVPRAGEPPAP